MGKESKYTFAKPFKVENYKEWVREMIFTLKDLGLWGYVDSTIVKPVFLSAKKKTTAEAKQKTENKIDF